MNQDNNNKSENKINYTFSSIKNKKVEITNSEDQLSSDAGFLLLKQIEEHIGIVKQITDNINDRRSQDRITHQLEALLKQRIFQIAAGYEDANDSDLLRKDAILKIAADLLPDNNSDLGSQSTISRLENSISRSDLYRIARAIMLNFINSYEHEPEVIILDCDDTNNKVYGHQQLALFNNYYRQHCYQPLHIYEGLSGKLITAILKPGRRSKDVEVFSILSRVIDFLRDYWPNTRIIIRGDSHFCSSELMAWTKDKEKVNFITGLAGNQKLNDHSKVTIKSAEDKYKKDGKPIKFYHTFRYRAQSWSDLYRVIVKVEVNSKGTNIRYIVTDLEDFRTKDLYEKGYCARGKMELYIKDHKSYLQSDRSSCNSFEANQFRLFLHSVAYILIHTLQKQVLRGTKFYNSTMRTVQLKLIKVAARVKEIKTKIKIKLPKAFAYQKTYNKIFKIFEVMDSY